MSSDTSSPHNQHCNAKQAMHACREGALKMRDKAVMKQGTRCCALLAAQRALTDLLLLVKGDTREASASLSARPAWAACRAAQSLPPSPHMPTTSPALWCTLTCPSTSHMTHACDALTDIHHDLAIKQRPILRLCLPKASLQSQKYPCHSLS